MGQLLMKLLVGAIAGLLVWTIFEPMAPRAAGSDVWAQWEFQFILALGAGTGLTVGALNGWIQGSKLHLARGAGLGLLFGMIGAPLGYQIGGAIATGIFPANIFIDPTASIITKTIARVMALTPIGIFLGAAIGASSLNTRRLIQGTIGGLIGAMIGGFLFDTLGAITGPMNVALQGVKGGTSVETGALSRGLYAVLMAGLIALFIGIIDLLARSAWVRLVLGRNEGKEWPVDAPQVFIGRNEKAQIPLFGDQNVAPMHACIIRQGKNAYVLADGGSPAGTYLNGQRIQQAPLFHGAQIGIGSFTLQFLMKHGAAPVQGPEGYVRPYAVGGQIPIQPASVAAQSGPAPGSLYGSPSATQMTTPMPSGGFAASQPTMAYPASQASQPTMAYGSAPVAGGFSLAVMDGPLAGQRFPVRGPTEVGREAAGIPTGFDSNASRRHASFMPGPAGLTVSDLGSTNGTFVNGQRVQTANVGPGDLIKIGATTFRVEVG